MAKGEVKIRNTRSGIESEVSIKEWETIQSNHLVAKNYVFVSSQSQKPTKTSTEESK